MAFSNNTGSVDNVSIQDFACAFLFLLDLTFRHHRQLYQSLSQLLQSLHLPKSLVFWKDHLNMSKRKKIDQTYIYSKSYKKTQTAVCQPLSFCHSLFKTFFMLERLGRNEFDSH